MAEMSAGGFESESGPLDAMGNIDGFPFAGMSLEDDWTVVSIEKTDVKDSAFRPGPNDNKREMTPFQP